MVTTLLFGLAAVTACEDPPSPPLPGIDGAPHPTSTAAPGRASVTASTSASADAAGARQLALLRGAAKRNPESVDAQMRLADHCLDARRWDEAEAAVDAALALDADHDHARRVKRYLPELRAAQTIAARRKLTMQMASESLSQLGTRLEGAASVERYRERTARNENDLRGRFAINDTMLRDQRARYATMLVQLDRALDAIEDLAAREKHIRKVLEEDPERIGAMVKLLDVSIARKRYAQARKDVVAFRRGFPEDLELRLYEHHIEALTDAESSDRERAIVMALAMERRTLLTMITNAKIGKLERKP